MNIVYGLGVAAIVALSFFLHSQALLSVTFLVGVMLFVSDLFGPIKALYTQATRLTVMNSCMDRIEEVFGEKELPDNGNPPFRKTAKRRRWRFKTSALPMGKRTCSTTFPSPSRSTPWRRW